MTINSASETWNAPYTIPANIIQLVDKLKASGNKIDYLSNVTEVRLNKIPTVNPILRHLKDSIRFFESKEFGIRLTYHKDIDYLSIELVKKSIDGSWEKNLLAVIYRSNKLHWVVSDLAKKLPHIRHRVSLYCDFSTATWLYDQALEEKDIYEFVSGLSFGVDVIKEWTITQIEEAITK